MAGIIRQKNQKSIIVNGTSNHVHVFVGLKPTMLIADLARDIKNNTTYFINSNRWLPDRFQWQEGYGAFSYGHSQMEQVYRYILNQEKHHHKRTFKEEYLELLIRFSWNTICAISLNGTMRNRNNITPQAGFLFSAHSYLL
jgi:putative transposase